MDNESDLISNWLYITPITGLWLTKETNNELKIGNVIFISKEKLPRVRKRLGIPVAISQLEKIGVDNSKSKKKYLDDFFSASKTYAITQFSGIPSENEVENIRRIERAINLVSMSNLHYSNRNFNQKIEIKSADKHLYNRKIIIDKRRSRFTFGVKTLHALPVEINKRWVKFHKNFFYFELINIINNKKTIKSKWRNTIISVANLIGKSINSHDIAESFLRNMIALEMLLVNQQEKIKITLIERSAYLLDWCNAWEENNLSETIENLYKKRCDYVHNGNTEDITKNDLILSDDLLFNLMNNIIKNIENIDSKGKLIEFSDKYQCEKKLGLKSKFQFPKFQYISKVYEDIDLEKI